MFSSSATSLVGHPQVNGVRKATEPLRCGATAQVIAGTTVVHRELESRLHVPRLRRRGGVQHRACNNLATVLHWWAPATSLLEMNTIMRALPTV